MISNQVHFMLDNDIEHCNACFHFEETKSSVPFELSFHIFKYTQFKIDIFAAIIAYSFQSKK
jgi:hypothetical protein